MAKLDRKSKTEFVALGRMFVSEMAQREEREYRVDALLAEFDPDRIGHPVLSHRDGRYYIVDGQHRVAALKRFLAPNWEHTQIECQVFSGMSETEEAEMFLRLNDTLRVGVFDKYRAAVTAGRAVESTVKEIVEKQGLSISKGKTPGSIGAVSTLLSVYRRSNAQTLGRALRIIRDAYGDSGFEASVIDGLGHLCQRYNGTLDEQLAKQQLQAARGGVKGLLGKARTLQLSTGNQRAHCVAAAAVEIINAKRGGKKLPSWWKSGESVDG